MYYGLTNKAQAAEIARKVVEVLGGGENAILLMLETAEQETKTGAFKDPSPYMAGVGVCQCDPIPFYDTKSRIPTHVKNEILSKFGIAVDEVRHRELAFSPLLSFLWCRMHYMLRPGSIPDTVEARAAYWKKWYNSELGKGTVQQYIDNAANVKL